MKLLKNMLLLITLTLASTIINAAPVITSISPIISAANQSIVIKGSGFGILQPYDGDSPYIRISDGWNAGSTLDSPSDWVTLNVTSWTDTQIIVSGFTGDYGSYGWTLNDGDTVSVQIWNAQTGAGPAVCSRIVNDNSPKSCLSIKGTVAWAKPPYAVQCVNNTTAKTVSIPRNAKAAYDCEKAGLAVKSGDDISVTIKGKKY